MQNGRALTPDNVLHVWVYKVLEAGKQHCIAAPVNNVLRKDLDIEMNYHALISGTGLLNGLFLRLHYVCLLVNSEILKWYKNIVVVVIQIYGVKLFAFTTPFKQLDFAELRI
jgi:hypothetical protein